MKRGFFFAVSKVRLFLKYWLLPLLWMSLIFSASSDTESFKRSSRIIGPLLRWLFPQMSEEAIDVVVLIGRKCAHLAVYGVLALLFWRALRKPQPADPRPWSWRTAWTAVFLVALYATTDEIHQHSVPGRDGNVRDVLLDTSGAMAAIVWLWAFTRWRQRRVKRNT